MFFRSFFLKVFFFEPAAAFAIFLFSICDLRLPICDWDFKSAIANRQSRRSRLLIGIGDLVLSQGNVGSSPSESAVFECSMKLPSSSGRTAGFQSANESSILSGSAECLISVWRNLVAHVLREHGAGGSNPPTLTFP